MILRVLLASSRPSLLEGARSTLGGDNVRLSSVPDAEQMWQRLETRPPDLLVVDEALLGESAGAALAAIEALPDSTEVIVLLARDDPSRRAELLDQGALTCLPVGIEAETLFLMLRTLVGRVRRRAVKDLQVRRPGFDAHLGDFASKSPRMHDFLGTARKLIRSSSTVLLLGETGVGKEFLARALHREGPRQDDPFVAVSCAALPETLLESELFGHAPGAFTGAARGRRGYFELAHRGTLFLDEVGELPAPTQVKLLRVLQDRIVQPLGSEKGFQVDVRLVAATNRDLRAEAKAGRFRSDLYYRLSVVTLTVPPLRERLEDIPDLVRSHVERFRTAMGRAPMEVAPAAMEALLAYSWPGNVRELINVIERAVLLGEGTEITPADLPEEIRDGISGRPPPPHSRAQDGAPGGAGLARWTHLPLLEARRLALEEMERAYLDRLLTETRGRIGLTAERAGITPRSLYEKMKQLGLSKEAYREVPGVEA